MESEDYVRYVLWGDAWRDSSLTIDGFRILSELEWMGYFLKICSAVYCLNHIFCELDTRRRCPVVTVSERD